MTSRELRVAIRDVLKEELSQVINLSSLQYEELISQSECAQLIGISPKNFTKELAETLPHVKIGKKRMFLKLRVLDFIIKKQSLAI